MQVRSIGLQSAMMRKGNTMNKYIFVIYIVLYKASNRNVLIVKMWLIIRILLTGQWYSFIIDQIFFVANTIDHWYLLRR